MVTFSEIPDTTAFTAAQLLAHHPNSERVREPGANPASFQGRMRAGELLVDYEYGEHPVTNQWCLRVSAYWQHACVFHATASSVQAGQEQRTTIRVHETQPGPWRQKLLAFVREQHAIPIPQDPQ